MCFPETKTLGTVRCWVIASSGRCPVSLSQGSTSVATTTRSGRLAELLGTTGATAGQLHAVETGKMITETEANVRKTVGVGVGLATAAIYATSGLPYATLSAGTFLSISTYRTGAEYQ